MNRVVSILRTPAVLLWIPVCVYALSYIYMTFYHGQWWLWNTIIHEDGQHTFWETLLYSTHFLGHLPVLTLAAVLFTGMYLRFTADPNAGLRRWPGMIAGLVLLLVFSLVLSFQHFGSQDLQAFMTQMKQNPSVYVQGGSWNLHLPSTIMLFGLVPAYIYMVKWIWGKGTSVQRGGRVWVLTAVVMLILFTWLFNGSPAPLVTVWQDPRYLAHAVRELATFPLIYFPLPLYFWLKSEPGREARAQRPPVWLKVLFSVFCAGLIYQVVVSLTHDIGSLAQKPAFASGGTLGVPYLLASHFFEHFLDTLYFCLLCLLLSPWAGWRGKNS